jgi:ubiquinone/menaquinone biosynthesis C-methylase UbiE
MTIDIDNGIPAKIKKLSQVYDSDYFENGPQTKKSNYRDYSWDRLGSYFQRTARHIVDLFKPERILDVGCAKGFLVKALDELGVDAYGIDPSVYAVSNAHPDVGDKINLDSAQSIPYPDNTFDVVTCFDVMGHIPMRETSRVLKELLRVSKEWVVIRVVTHEVEGDLDSSHETIRDREWWTERIEKAGGKVEANDAYFKDGVWWFNVPEFLMVVRKV